MGVIELSYFDVALGYIFVLVVLWLLKRRQINRQKELIFASIRMTVQLVLVGFILTWIFENPHPLITLVIILSMVSFAVFTVFRKFKKTLNPRLKKVIAISIPLGTLPVIGFFLWAVIQVDPYYNPQYFIPISGMIIGNSMTGISLGVQTLVNRFTHNKDEVLTLLYFGATPKEASFQIVNDGFDAAIMPTLNSMLGMGIIFLPGMMTGQILSGTLPTTAILYQIMIMLGILGGVSLTTYGFLAFGYRTFFNQQQQLR